MFLYVTVEVVLKDIPSIDLECFAIFALKDAREGDDFIFMGRAFHNMLARWLKGSLNPSIKNGLSQMWGCTLNSI